MLARNGFYKLLRKGLALSVINCCDSNNHTHVVGLGLLADETAETLESFMECFIKDHSESYQKIRCFMTDKDLTEHHVLKKLFPNAKLFLSEFHTLRTFKREIIPSKMETTQEINEINF